MRKKFKVTLVVFLIVVLGCFSQVFAQTNQNNRTKEGIENSRNVKLTDDTNDNGIDEYTKLLMHMDDDNFKDECGHDITNNNNVTLDTVNKYFGKGSVSFNGHNYLNLNNYKDFNFLHQLGTNGKWTIDFWIKDNIDNSNEQSIIDTCNGTGSNSGIWLGIQSGNLYGGICNSTKWIANWSVKYPNDKKWHHIEINYDQSLSLDNWHIFIDGKLAGSGTKTSNAPSTSDCYCFEIGQFQNNYYLNANIDELRISKDIVRHTSDFNPPTNPYGNALAATGISLNRITDSLILNDPIKRTDTLTATVTPDNVTSKTVNWVSSDPNIVTVDSNGKITALKAGTATITATTTDGSNLSKSCTVTVNEPTNITLDKTTDLINVGDTDKITASVTPVGQDVTWTSSDEGIVKVDQNENITGLKAGTAIITATTADGKTASCTVTVKDQELGKSKLTLYMNDKTIREFYLTQDEIDNFIDWYTSKIKGEVTMQPYYVFNVSVQGKSSTKKSYVWFMKIESFEVE